MAKFWTADAPLAQAMKFYKAARIFDPNRILDLQHEVVGELSNIPFISADDVKSLVEEMPAYMSLHCPAEDLGVFWRQRIARIPTWYRIAFIVALVQPSSACVERIFSLLRNLFNDRQESTLQDYIEGSVRLSYNMKQRSHLP